MYFLFLSILLNAFISVIFGYFRRYNIDNFQAIVLNYGVCIITGSLVLGEFPVTASVVHQPYFKWSVLMGVLFISVFNLIAYSSQKVGVTITQTANRLSLVIPVALSVFLYGDQVSVLKIAGIVIAILAVILVSSNEKEPGAHKLSILEILLPFILFVSSGIIDSLTKYVQNTYLNSESLSNTYLILGFGIAFILGFSFLLFLLLTGRKKFNVRNVIAGICLGVPNYFSIYFLVKALQSPVMSSSATIPINNIGVLLVVSLFGILVFKEKLSRKNYVGLGLTLLAIFLIYLGDKAA
ncbi:MAG TPA: hypothetical protein PLU10_01635 [Chitinophagaceae bacterium]|nr:hypothetical protein [Chitinophagaceae bacterium]